jgi:hypothetical protein
MSALPPKADIAECDGDVRFLPKADIRAPTASRTSSSPQALAVNEKANGERRKGKYDHDAGEYHSQPNTR